MKCLRRASRKSRHGSCELIGDKLWHAVTPLGKDEERIILTLQYVTNQEMGPFKKMFSNLTDAVAYFGPAALLPWNPSKEKG